MGCAVTKVIKHPEPTYVFFEAKVFEPTTSELSEWKDMMRRNDLNMDQINLESAQDMVREQESLNQDHEKRNRQERDHLEEEKLCVIEESDRVHIRENILKVSEIAFDLKMKSYQSELFDEKQSITEKELYLNIKVDKIKERENTLSKSIRETHFLKIGNSFN